MSKIYIRDIIGGFDKFATIAEIESKKFGSGFREDATFFNPLTNTHEPIKKLFGAMLNDPAFLRALDISEMGVPKSMSVGKSNAVDRYSYSIDFDLGIFDSLCAILTHMNDLRKGVVSDDQADEIGRSLDVDLKTISMRGADMVDKALKSAASRYLKKTIKLRQVKLEHMTFVNHYKEDLKETGLISSFLDAALNGFDNCKARAIPMGSGRGLWINS